MAASQKLTIPEITNYFKDRLARLNEEDKRMGKQTQGFLTQHLGVAQQLLYQLSIQYQQQVPIFFKPTIKLPDSQVSKHQIKQREYFLSTSKVVHENCQDNMQNEHLKLNRESFSQAEQIIKKLTNRVVNIETEQYFAQTEAKQRYYETTKELYAPEKQNLIQLIQAYQNLEEQDPDKESFAICWELLLFQFQSSDVEGSLNFLEYNFRKNLQAQTSSNNIESAVRIYIKKLEKENKLGQATLDYNNDYPWAILYFLLRSGSFEQAQAFVNKQSEKVISQAFNSYMNKIKNNSDIQGFPPAKDIYRNTLLNIIQGNPEADVHEKLTFTVEDYLWIQIRTTQDFSIGQKILKLGYQHFNNILIYFFCLLVVRKYDDALLFLKENNYLLEGVHFAIVLQNFNFDLIEAYSRQFWNYDTETALFYLSLSNNPQSVVNMLIHTQKLDLLLSQQFKQQFQADYAAICKLVAKKVQEINPEFASKLYHEAGAIHQIFELWTKVLKTMIQHAIENRVPKYVGIQYICPQIWNKYWKEGIIQEHNYITEKIIDLDKILKFFHLLNQNKKKEAIKEISTLSSQQLQSDIDSVVFQQIQNTLRNLFASDTVLAKQNQDIVNKFGI